MGRAPVNDIMKFLFLIEKCFSRNDVAIVVANCNTTKARETMAGNECLLGAKP